jgi:polar amino acid transport system substrate-binding protein
MRHKSAIWFVYFAFLFLASHKALAEEAAAPPSTIEQNQPSLQQTDSHRLLTPGQIALQLSTQPESPDIVCIEKSRALRVAILNQEASPFFFTNKQGELDGIDVRIAKQLAIELGVKLEFIKLNSFDEVVDSVVTKKAHVGISKLSVTMDRAKKVRYAGGYVTMSKGLLINRLELKKLKSESANTIEDVLKQPEASIGVLANSAYEKYARGIFPKTKIKTYKTWDEILDATVKGEILAAFRDEWEIRKALDKRPDLPIYAEAVFLKNQNDPIQMIVPWNSYQLAHFLDMFILINSRFHYDVPKLFDTYKSFEKDKE